eukprot:CAMPEP_0174752162 /NCGR_PEP_ID=MMETSP1094-20130205/101426_1 /TAXON_ID=156173 /ORGANISM="Chrysochromulina brevifilum, Strain UTEX LB 985" /LENGTH=94 /DNA_ID=CAMNT_0015957763 /DNA_START=93 /DNA_END=378 /DNA_ORIENTATION=+
MSLDAAASTSIGQREQRRIQIDDHHRRVIAHHLPSSVTQVFLLSYRQQLLSSLNDSLCRAATAAALSIVHTSHSPSDARTARMCLPAATSNRKS